ncbi:unnamed protein product [Brachionus calyciflorus]|uniref:CCHC-type domain-containing protein n=1 Tax=Brachionus calyciflorus TaxID=104777 RepID=A0A814HGA2_9BILA|nr:unnamed protein product [Brachionus calyciflorus]
MLLPHQDENGEHILILAVASLDQYIKVKNEWPEDAFDNGITVTDRPPNLHIMINNVDKNIRIDPNDKRIIELTNRYGIIEVERIYGQDKLPTNKIKANVLTLINYIELLKNGIYLDLTSMRHVVKPAINYARVCSKCGSLSHGQKECRNQERCLKCGNSDHLILKCKNTAKCINCSGNHQCNSDACELLAKRTLSANKYILDVLVKESIIESADKIFKVPRQNIIGPLLVDNSIEHMVNKILDSKLQEYEQRLKVVEKTTAENLNGLNLLKDDFTKMDFKINELNSAINSLTETTTKTNEELSSIKESITKTDTKIEVNHSQTHQMLLTILQRLPPVQDGDANTNL